jgi:O-antigen/teichoic acid export membrane protein
MGWTLSMTGRHVLEFTILTSGLVVAVVLCAIAVPAQGQLGAAIATFCAVAFVNLSRMLCVRRVLGAFPLDGRLVVFAVAAIGLALVAKLIAARLPLNLFWSSGAGLGLFLACYAGACWWYLRKWKSQQDQFTPSMTPGAAPPAGGAIRSPFRRRPS